jgi:hypothetical protein
MAKSEMLIDQLYGRAVRTSTSAEFSADYYRDKALEAWGITHHSKAVAIWDHAWENHHSEGVQAVLDEFDTLVSLLA